MRTLESVSTEAQALLKDADRAITSIRGSLLICRQDGGFEEAMLQVGRLRSLEDAAAESGLAPVAIALSTLVHESARIISSGNGLPDEEACLLLDQVAHVEAEIVKARPNESNDDVDISEFLDRSFVGLWGNVPGFESERGFALEEDSEPVDEFEPDEEMLSIFRIEADELLSNIEASLDDLAGNPADRKALWEIRRNAHTLKGAAGIIGLRQLSHVAHKIEDLLDHLSESEIDPDAFAVQLLAGAAALMRDIVAGQNGDALSAAISTVCVQLDSLLARYRDDPNHDSKALLVLPETPSVKGPPAEVDPLGSGRPRGSPRPIVRVAITRLDELSDSVRELLLSRTALARRIDDLEKIVSGLSETSRRVRASAHRIENDFEAAMLDDVRRMPSIEQSTVSFGRPHRAGGNLPFDPLEMDRYTAFHSGARELAESAQECYTLSNSLETQTTGLTEAFNVHRRLIEQAQQRVMQIRLIRFGSIATRLERAVRVTCLEQDKLAEIYVADHDVEIDTDILDSLVEPLMHLVRNAVAHGIENADMRRLVGKPEKGIITVRAFDEGTHIVVTVTDDGRGISGKALLDRAVSSGRLPAAEIDLPDSGGGVDLIFMPGLTTADKLTMSAGRGVGLSIVKQSVEDMGGSVTVETNIHVGTAFTVKVPLEFSVAQTVLVRSAGNTAAIPTRSVLGFFEVAKKDLGTDEEGATAKIDDKIYPFRRLSSYFNIAIEDEQDRNHLKILLISSEGEPFALSIDDFLGSEEIIIRALTHPLSEIPGVLGGALLGTGDVVPVLDMRSLFESGPVREAPVKAANFIRPLRILVVDDSPSVRHMTANTLKTAGCEPITARDGLDALELIRQGPVPDVILSDVEMPEMDGFAFAEAIKAEPEYREIPFLFVTSRVSEKYRQRAAKLGITGHLAKPFTISDIINVVKKACS